MPPAILLGTTNAAKQRQLSWLLEGTGLILKTPAELRQHPEVEESGPDHESNAVRKALAWSEACRGLAISSDGGLLIPALGSRWDSLVTHRFAGPTADDHVRIEGLLELMRPYRAEERKVSWIEAVALARPGRLLSSWQVEGGMGVLLDGYDPHRMIPGFWVYSLFYFPRLRKTYGELDEKERKAVGDPWTQIKPLVQSFVCQLGP